MKTPAELATAALAALADITDPRERAIRGHELQVVIKDAPATLRPLVDSAVAELRKDMTVAQVAELLGVSEQRVSQMATGRHRHKPTTTLLPDKDFDALVASLDEPAESIPQLVDLFKRPRTTPPADADA